LHQACFRTLARTDFLVLIKLQACTGEPLVYQHYGTATTEKGCKEKAAEFAFRIGDFKPKIQFVCERFSAV